MSIRLIVFKDGQAKKRGRRQGQGPAPPGARRIPVDGLPLRLGAAGEAVRDLQRRLATAGFDPGQGEHGRYGEATKTAVRAFQVARGLDGNGVCDLQTWTAIVEAGYQLGDGLLYLRRPMQRGDDVAELQRRLGMLGFDPWPHRRHLRVHDRDR
jgi:peptidoglycan hydrolase-like protein with peptidoglycan-binding domain